jgi:hypothetical protein
MPEIAIAGRPGSCSGSGEMTFVDKPHTCDMINPLVELPQVIVQLPIDTTRNTRK